MDNQEINYYSLFVRMNSLSKLLLVQTVAFNSLHSASVVLNCLNPEQYSEYFLAISSSEPRRKFQEMRHKFRNWNCIKEHLNSSNGNNYQHYKPLKCVLNQSPIDNRSSLFIARALNDISDTFKTYINTI